MGVSGSTLATDRQIRRWGFTEHTLRERRLIKPYTMIAQEATIELNANDSIKGNSRDGHTAKDTVARQLAEGGLQLLANGVLNPLDDGNYILSCLDGEMGGGNNTATKPTVGRVASGTVVKVVNKVIDAKLDFGDAAYAEKLAIKKQMEQLRKQKQREQRQLRRSSNIPTSFNSRRRRNSDMPNPNGTEVATEANSGSGDSSNEDDEPIDGKDGNLDSCNESEDDEFLTFIRNNPPLHPAIIPAPKSLLGNIIFHYDKQQQNEHNVALRASMERAMFQNVVNEIDLSNMGLVGSSDAPILNYVLLHRRVFTFDVAVQRRTQLKRSHISLPRKASKRKIKNDDDDATRAEYCPDLRADTSSGFFPPTERNSVSGIIGGVVGAAIGAGNAAFRYHTDSVSRNPGGQRNGTSTTKSMLVAAAIGGANTLLTSDALQKNNQRCSIASEVSSRVYGAGAGGRLRAAVTASALAIPAADPNRAKLLGLRVTSLSLADNPEFGAEGLRILLKPHGPLHIATAPVAAVLNAPLTATAAFAGISSHLTRLDLTGCSLGNEGALLIANNIFIQQRNRVHKIKFADAAKGDMTMAGLTAGQGPSTLLKSDSSKNPVKSFVDSTRAATTSAVKSRLRQFSKSLGSYAYLEPAYEMVCPNLEVLILDDNNIGDKGFIALCEAITICMSDCFADYASVRSRIKSEVKKARLEQSISANNSTTTASIAIPLSAVKKTVSDAASKVATTAEEFITAAALPPHLVAPWEKLGKCRLPFRSLSVKYNVITDTSAPALRALIGYYRAMDITCSSLLDNLLVGPPSPEVASPTLAAEKYSIIGLETIDLTGNSFGSEGLLLVAEAVAKRITPTIRRRGMVGDCYHEESAHLTGNSSRSNRKGKLTEADMTNDGNSSNVWSSFKHLLGLGIISRFDESDDPYQKDIDAANEEEDLFYINGRRGHAAADDRELREAVTGPDFGSPVRVVKEAHNFHDGSLTPTPRNGLATTKSLLAGALSPLGAAAAHFLMAGGLTPTPNQQMLIDGAIRGLSVALSEGGRRSRSRSYFGGNQKATPLHPSAATDTLSHFKDRWFDLKLGVTSIDANGLSSIILALRDAHDGTTTAYLEELEAIDSEILEEVRRADKILASLQLLQQRRQEQRAGLNNAGGAQTPARAVSQATAGSPKGGSTLRQRRRRGGWSAAEEEAMEQQRRAEQKALEQKLSKQLGWQQQCIDRLRRKRKQLLNLALNLVLGGSACPVPLSGNPLADRTSVMPTSAATFSFLRVLDLSNSTPRDSLQPVRVSASALAGSTSVNSIIGGSGPSSARALPVPASPYNNRRTPSAGFVYNRYIYESVQHRTQRTGQVFQPYEAPLNRAVFPEIRARYSNM